MNKNILIIAIVAVVIIIAAVAVVVMNNNSEESKVITDVTVDNEGALSDMTIRQGLNGEKGDSLLVTIAGAPEDSSVVKINASGFGHIANASKSLTLINGNNKAVISKDACKTLSSASGQLTVTFNLTQKSSNIVKVLGNDYDEVRAMASVNITNKDGMTVSAGNVTFSTPYKLNKDYMERAENALQWDSKLNSSPATFEKNVATFSGKANDRTYFAFMTAENVAYYPVTYTTMIGGQPVTQTLNHYPARTVVFWDSSIELTLLFGMKDTIKFAFGDPNYTCLNPEVQSQYNSLTIISDDQTKIPGYLEQIRATEPDLLIGWASTFSTTTYGGLTTYDIINSWGTQCLVDNRPSDALSDYYTIVENMGIVANDMETANKIIKNFEDSVTAFKKKLAEAGITEDKKKKAVIIETMGTNVFTYGAAFLTGDLITQAGGINLFKDGMGRVGAEDLLDVCLPGGKDNIDVIILFADDGDCEKAVEDFKNTPAYATLSKRADIYALTFAQLYMGGVMQNDILDIIFEMLYPELN